MDKGRNRQRLSRPSARRVPDSNFRARRPDHGPGWHTIWEFGLLHQLPDCSAPRLTRCSHHNHNLLPAPTPCRRRKLNLVREAEPPSLLDKLKPLDVPRLPFSGPSTFVKAFEAATKSQQKPVWVSRAASFAMPTADQAYGWCLALHSDRQETTNMTKTTNALLAGAAFPGFFARTAPATKASTPPPSLKTSFSALGQDQDKKDDKKVKEKHACKGQNSCKGKGGCKAGDNGCKGKNSCKGKGGCATDGSKPPAE